MEIENEQEQKVPFSLQGEMNLVIGGRVRLYKS